MTKILMISTLEGFKYKTVLGFSLLFIIVGIMHFTHTSFFVKIVPPFIPYKAFIVYLSGVCEIVGGLGLLMPNKRRAVAYFLVLLLIAISPANIYHAVGNVQFGGSLDIPFIQWARLPLQLVLIWLLLWSTK